MYYYSLLGVEWCTCGITECHNGHLFSHSSISWDFKVKVPAVLVSNEALFLAFRRLPIHSVLSLALLHASEERERVGRNLWRLFLFFFFFFNFLFYIGVQPISKVVVVSCGQQRELSHTYMCIQSPQTPFPSRLPRKFEQSSLCHTQVLILLSMIYIAVCTC